MRIRVFSPIFSFAFFMVLIWVALSSAHPPSDECEPALPIVFVHGGAGSAAQYETQAMRFASNGYPNIVTGIDRVSSEIQPIYEQLDQFFDAVMDRTGDDRIYVAAHSAGTAIMVGYLNSSEERSARIAKYINIDGAKGESCPGTPEPVDCINISRTGSLGPVNINFPDFQHTQCVTAPESFVEQYAFLTGKAPKTSLVLPEPACKVEVAGRVIYFPANTAVDGSTLQLWEIDKYTGKRLGKKPLRVIDIGPGGEFGPVRVNGRKHYEFSLLRDDVAFETHYYFQPFIRSNHLVRLLATPPESDILANTAQGPDHTAVVILRYFDFLTGAEAGNDTLWVSTTSPAWDDDPVNPTPAACNILSDPEMAPSANKLGIHAHDAGSDKISSLAVIPWFYNQFFQTGVDIWMPATEPPDGTITLMNEPAGDTTRPQIINIPNWTSEGHRVLVMFNSYFQDINTWRERRRTSK